MTKINWRNPGTRFWLCVWSADKTEHQVLVLAFSIPTELNCPTTRASAASRTHLLVISSGMESSEGALSLRGVPEISVAISSEMVAMDLPLLAVSSRSAGALSEGRSVAMLVSVRGVMGWPSLDSIGM